MELPDYHSLDIEIGKRVYCLLDLCSDEVPLKIKKKIIKRAEINREVLKFALLHDLPEDLIYRIIRRCEKIDEPFYVKVRYQGKMVYTALELAVLQRRSDKLIKAIVNQESDFPVIRWFRHWLSGFMSSKRVSEIREAVMKEIELDNQPFETVVVPEVVLIEAKEPTNEEVSPKQEKRASSPLGGLVFSEPKKKKREWRHEVEHNFKGLVWATADDLNEAEKRMVSEVLRSKGWVMESLLLNYESDLRGVMDLETQEGAKLYQHLLMPKVNVRLQKAALKHQLKISAERLVKMLLLKTPDQEIMSFLKNKNGLVLSMSPNLEIQRSDFSLEPQTILDLAIVWGASDALIKYLYQKKHRAQLKNVEIFKEERLMDMLCNASGRLILTPGMVAAYPKMLCDVQDDEGNFALELALEGQLSDVLLEKLLMHMKPNSIARSMQALTLSGKEDLAIRILKKRSILSKVQNLCRMYAVRNGVSSTLRKASDISNRKE